MNNAFVIENIDILDNLKKNHMIAIENKQIKYDIVINIIPKNNFFDNIIDENITKSIKKLNN